MTQPNAMVELPMEHDTDEPAIELRVLTGDKNADGEGGSLGSELPAIDTSLQAWLFVLGSLLLEFIVWGYGYAFGVLQEFYLSKDSPILGSSSLAISSIGTIGVGLQYMLGIFFEAFYKAYPQHIKKSMWISLGVSVGSFLISSWATSVWQLILLQGVIFGFSSAALYFPVIVWLSEWFFHRRSTAAGVIFGGSSGGGVIFPFMFRYLLDSLGYANAMRVWAGIFCLLGGMAIPMIKPRITVSRQSREGYRTPLRFPDFSFVLSTQFLMFATTVLAQRLAYSPMTVLIASYSSHFENVNILQSTLALVILNLSGLIGYVVTGYSSDRITYWKVMVASGTCAALAASLVLGFAQNIGAIYGFGVCFGIASGGYASVWTAAAKSIKEEVSGTVFLTFSLIGGIATIVGPLIAGALQTPAETVSPYGTHGFRNVVVLISSLLAFIAGMGAVIGWRGRKVSPAARLRQS